MANNGIQFSTCMYLFLLFLIYKAQSLKCGFMKTSISLQIHHPYMHAHTHPCLWLATSVLESHPKSHILHPA